MKTLDWLKIDVNGEFLLPHVKLLIQKTTADDDDDITPVFRFLSSLFFLHGCMTLSSSLLFE